LCYDKGKTERAITWHPSVAIQHERIDDGERIFYNKMTPILVADGTFEKDIIAKQFKRAAIRIDKEIASLIYNVLRGYPS